MSASQKDQPVSQSPGPAGSGAAVAEQDDLVLQLRSAGRSFGTIAKRLGLEHTWMAVAAFNRALRQRPAAEQEQLREDEAHKLDALAASLESNIELDAATRTRRLAAVDRLRVALFST